MFALSVTDHVQLHFTLVAGLLALICSVIMLLSGLTGPAPRQQQIDRFTFHRRTVLPDTGVAWWQDYRLRSAALVALAVLLVEAHW